MWRTSAGSHNKKVLNIVTFSQGQSPPWKASISWTNWEIVCILWNMSIDYCADKILLFVPVLRWMNAVEINKSEKVTNHSSHLKRPLYLNSCLKLSLYIFKYTHPNFMWTECLYWLWFFIQPFEACSQNCEKWLLALSCPSVHPSAWNISVPTRWIFMKFDYFSEITWKYYLFINIWQ